MKIKYADDQQLFLEHRPYFLTGMVIVFLLAFIWGLITEWSQMSLTARGFYAAWIVGLLAIAHYLVRWVRVRFDRTAGQIEVWSKGLLHDQATVYPMRMLEEIAVLSHRSEGSTFRRLALSFDKSFEHWLPDDRRRTLEKHIARGFCQHALRQVPLTKFSEASAKPRQIADAINHWLNVST